MDDRTRRVNSTTVLLCSRVRPDAGAAGGAVVVDDLCERPAAAAAALRAAATSRVVLGICERRPSAELEAALRRAGAAPFGVEAVCLAGRKPQDAARLLAAAHAKLDALPAGERGRPTLNGSAISRRTLLSPGGALTRARVAVLDESRCAGTTRCDICVERCPVGAIAAATPFPSIEPAACTACGRCVPRCPHGALHLTGAGTTQIEAQLEHLVTAVEGIVFACAAADAGAPPTDWALVELPTLALVSPGWILQLRTRGVEVRLDPCQGVCCAGARAVRDCADRVLERAVTTGLHDRWRIRLTEPRATADAIGRLASAHSAGVLEAEASPLGILTLDAERCTLCGACAAACPTDALWLSETAEQSALQLRAEACVACGRCAAVCPEDAVDIRSGIDFARLEQGTVDLASAAREVCARCGADLPPEPMRRRLREILPELEGSPRDLCSRCGRAPPEQRDQSRGPDRLSRRIAADRRARPGNAFGKENA
jgi:ferredoxin